MMSIASNQALVTLVTLFLVIPPVAMLSPTNMQAESQVQIISNDLGDPGGGMILPACSPEMLQKVGRGERRKSRDAKR